MAVGNTFGATALSSYGGFWISYAIILTPAFNIVPSYAATGNVETALGFYLAGWFVFTTILLICTLRSTVAFFLLFFFLDLAFLLLTIAKFEAAHADTLNIAGGYFGLFAAFMAWYNAMAGIADDRLVLPTEIQVSIYLTLIPTATPSSLSPLRISHGLLRCVRPAPNPSARLSKFGFTTVYWIQPFYCLRTSLATFKKDAARNYTTWLSEGRFVGQRNGFSFFESLMIPVIFIT